jgi:DNA-binding PadR family transcriptional regulator
LVGLYALTVMDREGSLHGYGLSERIAQHTEGAWRPGPGSVYPSLRQLVAAGLARSQPIQRRRVYTITPNGRALLRQIRRGGGPLRRPRPDLSSLWAEVYGSVDVERFLLLRLRRTLDSLEALTARSEETGSEAAARLRSAIQTELAEAVARFSSVRPPIAGEVARSRRVMHAR